MTYKIVIPLSFLLSIDACAISREPIGEAPASIGACFACSNWTNEGERRQVCASPSQGILDAQIACYRAAEPAGCGTVCDSWLKAYDGCANGSNLSCAPGQPSDACLGCMYGACYSATLACSADLTECTHCGVWLGGAYNLDLLCATDADQIAAMNVGACACTTCSGQCGNACTMYAPNVWTLNPQKATQGCRACLAKAAPKGCAPQRDACLAL